MRVSLEKIVHLSETGPFMRESEFDLKLIKTVFNLVTKYGIKFDRTELVPSDNNLPDNVYQAALDLLTEMGVYNQSTERRILLSTEEIVEAVASAPKEIVLGDGQDATTVRVRAVEDSSPCIMIGGPTGTPTSEEYHQLILQSVAQEPLVAGIGSGSVATLHGQPIIPGSPTEILAARRDAIVAREAISNAGRPDMHIHDVSSPLTCAGKMASISESVGMRSSDALLVSQLPELKTDYDQLSRVAHLQNENVNIVDLMTPLIGGLGGGAEGTAVVTVASHLVGVILYHATHHYMGHMSLQWSHNTGPLGLWIQSVSGQSIARNTHIISFNDIYPRAGLGSSQMLIELAAGALVGAVCGLHQHGVGCTGGVKTDHSSGLESRFQIEVAHAALGMGRNDVNKLIINLVSKYESDLASPAQGKSFSEVYDLESLEPTEEWQSIYKKVSDMLLKEGLNLDRDWKVIHNG